MTNPFRLTDANGESFAPALPERNPGLEFANSFGVDGTAYSLFKAISRLGAPRRSAVFAGISGVSDGNGLSRNDISGSRNDISGSRNDISGSRNDVSGSRNDVSGSRNDVSGSCNDVSGSCNDGWRPIVPYADWILLRAWYRLTVCRLPFAGCSVAAAKSSFAGPCITFPSAS